MPVEKLGLSVKKEVSTNPEQAGKEFEKVLLADAGVQFKMTVGDASVNVTALPELQKPIPATGEQAGKKEINKAANSSQPNSEMLPASDAYVSIVGSTGFDFGDEHYRTDLSDAPAELVKAVGKKWSDMLANERMIDATAPQGLRDAVMSVRARYGEIIKAINQGRQNKMDSGAALVPDAQLKTRSQLLELAFSNRLPAAIAKFIEQEGAFVVETSPNNYIAIRIKPVTNGGRDIKSWEIVSVSGDSEFIPGQTDDKYLSHLSEKLKVGIIRTALFKRAASEHDEFLFQAQAIINSADQNRKQSRAVVGGVQAAAK